MAMPPFEAVSGPVSLYIGIRGVAAPEISADPPSADWTLLADNTRHSDEGVTVTPEETHERMMVDGSTLAQKVFRTDEDVMISVTLFDVRTAVLARAMNGATVTVQAAGVGEGGYQSIPLKRGGDVNTFALLVLGDAPYEDGVHSQWWIPAVYVASIGGLQYAKSGAAGIPVEFRTVELAGMGAGQYIAQDVAAT